MYNQDEIAWGHIMFAARTMGMIDRMFKDRPYCCDPWWIDQQNPTISFTHQKMDGKLAQLLCNAEVLLSAPSTSAAWF